MGLCNNPLFGDSTCNPYELINRTNAVKPGYNLKTQPFTLEVYMSCAGELCVIRERDSHYICGLSFSTVSDLARTQTIVDGMSKTVEPLVSNAFRVLGERYYEIRKWHKVRISRYGETDRFRIAGDNGSFSFEYMAKSIQAAYLNLCRVCEARLGDGLYMPVLHAYYKLLTKFKRGEPEAPNYYLQMAPLIDIVKKESYIKLSTDCAARELYLSIEDAANNLYGAFMDEAR